MIPGQSLINIRAPAACGCRTRLSARFHYDGALEEETVVAISGYGPSSTTVFDGSARFGRSR
jgi:hypothetical protein